MHVEISTLMSELHGAGERGHCGRVVLAIEGNVRVDETRHEFDEGAAHPFSQGEQMRQLLARFLFCTRLMQRQGCPMSAVAPIADKFGRGQFVRFVPIADITALVRNPWRAQHQIGRA